MLARRRLLASHALGVTLLLDGGGRFFREKASSILGVCKVGTRFLWCQILLLLVQRLELAEDEWVNRQHARQFLRASLGVKLLLGSQATCRHCRFILTVADGVMVLLIRR